MPQATNNSNTETIYYIMMAYKTGVGYVYWNALNGIDSTGAESGHNISTLSFITFLGTKTI
jgi:hypothetical protein